jgi:hypothetical protein
MPRKRSRTSQLYRPARLSNKRRAASRGPGTYAKRVVRRKTYGKSMRSVRACCQPGRHVRHAALATSILKPCDG